jgi:hypothetical protein
MTNYHSNVMMLSRTSRDLSGIRGSVKRKGNIAKAEGKWIVRMDTTGKPTTLAGIREP